MHSIGGSSSKHSKSTRLTSLQHWLCIRPWARWSNARVRTFTEEKRHFKCQEYGIHFVTAPSTASRKPPQNHGNLPPSPIRSQPVFWKKTTVPRFHQPHSEGFFNPYNCISTGFFFFFFSGCTWSSLLCTGVLYVQWAEATLLCGALALGTQASVAAAQGLFSTVSAVVGHGLSCSRARGTFPGQGSNPYPMHWQADSHALYHQQSLNFHWSSQYYSLC